MNKRSGYSAAVWWHPEKEKWITDSIDGGTPSEIVEESVLTDKQRTSIPHPTRVLMERMAVAKDLVKAIDKLATIAFIDVPDGALVVDDQGKYHLRDVTATWRYLGSIGWDWVDTPSERDLPGRWLVHMGPDNLMVRIVSNDEMTEKMKAGLAEIGHLKLPLPSKLDVSRKKIYIAGPYRAKAERTGLEICRLGHIAVVPHMMWSSYEGELPDEFFLEAAMVTLEYCDEMIVLAGSQSNAGTQAEIKRFKQLGRPVWTSITDFLNRNSESS
jgi:hypothetical protein